MPEDEIVAEGLFFQRIWKTYKIPLILGSVSLIAILFSGVLLVKSSTTTESITFSSESANPSAGGSSEANEKITVDIEGAVNKPGVYDLKKDARVEEAIAAAGGLSGEADEEKIAKNINRASTLVDGVKIYIPKTGDSSANNDENIVRHESGSSIIGQDTVNVNTASASELDTLPGVGPVTAQKIIAGWPYQTLEELVTKKAVSSSLFEKLKSQLTLY